MQCPECHRENPEGAKFCLGCGGRLALVCPGCGTVLPPDAKFCLECGTPVSAQPTAKREVVTDATAAKALRRLAPTQYAERLLEAGGQVAGERRLVTILFSDVKGSTAMAEALDPEDVMEIMDGAFDVLIEPIMRHEGTLARLMGDAILAFFGAPIAHEDDAERACRAALEIVEGARGYAARLEAERGIPGFNVRVGINTGLVVVGEVGSDLRVEYTAMGDAINTAARMEQNAPAGGIRITHDTYRHVRGVFDVQPQEPLAVKGKAEPVQTYVVLQAKPRAFRLGTRGVEGIETRMVGREAELKRLQDALYDVIEDGERQVITITGEAGVGKSRLLYEFDNWLELLDETVRYFKGRARQEMQSVPYALLRDLFAYRFEIQDSDSVAQVREKMIQSVGDVLGHDASGEKRAQLIGQLIGFDFSDSPPVQALRDQPQALHEQAMAHIEEFFAANSSLNPTVIFLEDLHWADDSSLDAINRLAEKLARQRLLVLCGARPGLFERRPHWGEGQTFHTRIDLEPLSRRDGRRLVVDILQKLGAVPEALRDLIVSGAEGNPFFIEELIKMLIEDGVIVKGEEAWRFEPARLAEVRVPDSLTGVLQARLDRLPLAERTVLQQASVVGRLFWDRAVAHIAGTAGGTAEARDVVRWLAALREREMVFQRETSAFAGAGEYIFKHNLLRETTYAGVLKRLRQVYHGLVADWLIQASGERVTEVTGLIADHLEAAGRSAGAVDYLLRTGDQARLMYAHAEAVGYYERALKLLRELGEHDQAARTLMKLGLTHHNAFDFRRAREAYEKGFSLWQVVSKERPMSAPAAAPHALRLDWGWEPRTLDPAKAEDSGSIAVVDELFSGLVEQTPDMNIVPAVARSWEPLEGGRTYIFHLRDDVRWSDGVPVTARDFEYAWKRVLDPAAASPVASLLDDVRGAGAYRRGETGDRDRVGVRALDEATLLVELEAPTAYFLQVLALSASYPVPRHLVEACGPAWTDIGTIVGNGPYLLQSWPSGQSMTLVANPGYALTRTGNVQRVEFVFIDPMEWQTRLAMYEADGLDLLALDMAPPAEKEPARQRHAGECFSYPGLGSYSLALNTRRPPFDDARVRRALILATDVERFVDELGQGYMFPATGGWVPPGITGHDPGIALPYDPGRARRLLGEAGYPNGRGAPTLVMLMPAGPTGVVSSEFLSAHWLEALGLEIRWELRTEWPAPLDMQSNAHGCLHGWSPDYPDPDNFLRVGFPWEATGWQCEAYAQLVDRARHVLDRDQRMQLYRQAGRILVEEAPLIPLTYSGSYSLVKPWVTRYPLSPIKVLFAKDVIIEPH